MYTQLYKKQREQLKTGDLIAFSGNGLFSELIKWKTGSDISHVGIVLNVETKGAMGRTVMFVESTALINIPDAETKEFIKGVQFHFLSQRLNNYNGDMWIAPLKEKLSDDNEGKMQQWLRRVHAEKVPYDAIQALGAGCDLIDKLIGLENRQDLSSLFCSELVTKALQEANVINPKINPSEVTPVDLLDYDCYGELIRINNESTPITYL